MRIIGHGIDIMQYGRTKTHLASADQDWLHSIFTIEEQAQADNPPHAIAFYSGRYAAKEAVAKALGTGFSGDVSWYDIEILRTPLGAAEVRLTHGAKNIAISLGITSWFVSISHTGDYAIASVIAAAD